MIRVTCAQALAHRKSRSDNQGGYMTKRQGARTAWKCWTKGRFTPHTGQRRFHLVTQKNARFKTSELFLSENVHLIFSDHGWPEVTETAESKTMAKGGLLDLKTKRWV